ncbi:MAG: hypothetical protein HRT57_12535 [Crocinitomicaceae bacterium]|nr:hypothetical protein [Crocinitomicaceae bacterium]
MKVYIGGIGSESNWKTEFSELTNGSEIQLVEGDSSLKKECEFILYVITPKMNGVEAIINVVNDSNIESVKTVFCALSEEGEFEFSKHQLKSLKATSKMIETNGGHYFTSLGETAQYIMSAI